MAWNYPDHFLLLYLSFLHFSMTKSLRLHENLPCNEILGKFKLSPLH